MFINLKKSQEKCVKTAHEIVDTEVKLEYTVKFQGSILK